MATTRRTSHKDSGQQFVDNNADVFSAPTILVNCMQYCPNCKALYPYLNDAFKAWLKGKGYALHINKDDARSTANFNKYGRLNGVRSTTPQIYAINGTKVAGISPQTDKWDDAKVRSLVEDLIAKVK